MLQNFFSFQGRLNRKPYWLRVLALVIAYFVVAFGLTILGAAMGLGGIAGIAAIPLFLLIIVSSISLAARRLHDRNKSAWWLAIFYLVPMILGGIALYMSLPADLASIADPDAAVPAMSMNPASIVMQLASFGLTIWGLIEIGFLKGTTGENQYGPDPLAGMQ